MFGLAALKFVAVLYPVRRKLELGIWMSLFADKSTEWLTLEHFKDIPSDTYIFIYIHAIPIISVLYKCECAYS